jgi:putative serine protease PepD
MEIPMRSLSLLAAVLTLATPMAAQSPSQPVPDMDQTGAGIVLSDVSAGSPAAKAGLKGGDVVVEMAGEETPSLVEMVAVLRAHQPGETIEVVFYRGDERKTVKVTLAHRPGA